MVRNVRELVLNQYLSFSTYPFQKGYSAPAPAPARLALLGKRCRRPSA